MKVPISGSRRTMSSASSRILRPHRIELLERAGRPGDCFCAIHRSRDAPLRASF